MSDDNKFQNEDPINPEYYKKGEKELIDLIDEYINGLDGPEAYYTGNILKYLYRWQNKHKDVNKKKVDLKKAAWYLDRLISHAEKTMEKGDKNGS